MDPLSWSVRQHLFEALQELYTCKIGSQHKDISYIDFSEAIRIDPEPSPTNTEPKPIHIKVYWTADDADLMVDIWYSTQYVNSYQNPYRMVDLTEPNYGDLLEWVKNEIVKAHTTAGLPVKRFV